MQKGTVRENMETKPNNSGSILMKKYRQYLLPSILTSLALALNEFVDGMLVSNSEDGQF